MTARVIARAVVLSTSRQNDILRHRFRFDYVQLKLCSVLYSLVKRLVLLDGRWMFRVEGDIVLVGHGDTKLLYVYASNPSSQPPFTQDDA